MKGSYRNLDLKCEDKTVVVECKGNYLARKILTTNEPATKQRFSDLIFFFQGEDGPGLLDISWLCLPLQMEKKY